MPYRANVRILPEEERSELRELIREAMREERPALVDEVKKGVRDDLDVRFELLGLSASTDEHRAEIKKDMEFLRIVRDMFRAAAMRLGGAIIGLIFLGLAALAGYGAWVKGMFGK